MGNEASIPIATRARAGDLMAIIIDLDVMLAKRKMKSNDLADAIGITPQNLSVLKSGRAKAIRFTTLEAICKHLDCQPGDLMRYDTEQNINE
jgi:putative transcriptional regulator